MGIVMTHGIFIFGHWTPKGWRESKKTQTSRGVVFYLFVFCSRCMYMSLFYHSQTIDSTWFGLNQIENRRQGGNEAGNLKVEFISPSGVAQRRFGLLVFLNLALIEMFATGFTTSLAVFLNAKFKPSKIITSERRVTNAACCARAEIKGGLRINGNQAASLCRALAVEVTIHSCTP
jgi:hypothetical protein